jgi:hypothetical protein
MWSGNKVPNWCEKEIKLQGNKKNVLFLFKVISAYLNPFVAWFKKCLKTVRKDLQRNSDQFGCHVLSLMSSTS